ncbi:MAG: lipoate protein ligase C-terminal domain-containing protein [Nitrososphaeraceae archaeon]
MKQLFYVYKTEKLLKIRLHYDEKQDSIQSIFISGDFFLYPEETLEIIEQNLVGVMAQEEAIKHKVIQSLAGSQPFGFNACSLTTAILLCLQQYHKERRGEVKES